MADIGPSYNCFVITGSPYPRENPLFDAIAINAAQEVVSCATNPSIASALNALATAPANELAAHALGLDAPSTGLLVNSMIVNVFDASVAWTTPTTSITAINAAGEPARGRIVFSPQTADAAPDIDRYTNDPLLRTVAGGGVGKMAPKQYDLPDLSTPYLGTAANAIDFPFRHVESVSEAMAVKTLRNDYLLEKNIAAGTDWTMSQPTRRFGFGVDYSTSPGTAVFNTGVAGPSRFLAEAVSPYPHSRPECTWVVWVYPFFFDRKGGKVGGDRFSIFGTEGWDELCGAVAVVVFDRIPTSNSVLRAGFTQSAVILVSAPPSFDAGWGYFETIGAAGWPLIGAAYIQARGPLVAGKSTNFGIVYNHDTLH